MTMREARRRAHAGANYLDAKLGRGWRRRIILRRLDMREGSFNPQSTRGSVTGCGCIVAQLDARDGRGSYNRGIRSLGLVAGVQLFSLGFDTTDGDYDRLTEAWKEEVRKR